MAYIDQILIFKVLIRHFPKFDMPLPVRPSAELPLLMKPSADFSALQYINFCFFTKSLKFCVNFFRYNWKLRLKGILKLHLHQWTTLPTIRAQQLASPGSRKSLRTILICWLCVQLFSSWMIIELLNILFYSLPFRVHNYTKIYIVVVLIIMMYHVYSIFSFDIFSYY